MLVWVLLVEKANVTVLSEVLAIDFDQLTICFDRPLILELYSLNYMQEKTTWTYHISYSWAMFGKSCFIILLTEVDLSVTNTRIFTPDPSRKLRRDFSEKTSISAEQLTCIQEIITSVLCNIQAMIYGLAYTNETFIYYTRISGPSGPENSSGSLCSP